MEFHASLEKQTISNECKTETQKYLFYIKRDIPVVNNEHGHVFKYNDLHNECDWNKGITILYFILYSVTDNKFDTALSYIGS